MLYNMKGYDMDDKTKQTTNDGMGFEAPEIGELLGTVAFKTVKYESKSIKAELHFDKDEDEISAINKEHMIRGDFNFIGVTTNEIATFLTSTTSVLKQYQNNELSGLKELTILDMVKNRQTVSVRTMLDTTKTRVTSEASVQSAVDKMKKQNKSTDEIRAQLEMQLKMLETK